MQSYIAHYRSPAASDSRASGLFEFESEHRAGSKANEHDARMRMLELYGKEAVSWMIDDIELKRSSDAQSDGQLQMDFRPPKAERKRPKRKEWW